MNSVKLKFGGALLLGCLGCLYIQFINISLPWYIDLAAVCFPIFYIGLLLRQAEILSKLSGRIIIAGAIVYVISMILNAKYAGGVNIYYGRFGLYPLFYIEGILGSIIVLWLCMKYKLQAKTINFIGRESIIFYALHQPSLMAISSFILKPIIQIVELNTIWRLNCYSAIQTIIICLLGVPCVWIIKNKLPWIIGKKV